MAAAAATAATATPIAQTDIPQSVPQTGAQGSQGSWHGELQGEHGVGQELQAGWPQGDDSLQLPHDAPGGHGGGCIG